MSSIRRLVTTISTIALATILSLGLALPASAATAGPATRGVLDSVTAKAGAIKVVGWAYDLREPGASSSMDVVVDGRMAALPMANVARPDVDRVFHVTGNHGFNITIATATGAHRVCVVARPVAGSGSTWKILGCRTVTVPRA